MTTQTHTPDPAAEPPTHKVCAACGETFPANDGYFRPHAQSKDGLQSRCRECVAAAERQREADRHAAKVAERVKDAAREALDRDFDDALTDIGAVLGWLTGGLEPPRPIDLSTDDGRRDALRLRVELAPPGGAADAGASARRLMAAADDAEREVREQRVSLHALAAALAQPELSENGAGAPVRMSV